MQSLTLLKRGTLFGGLLFLFFTSVQAQIAPVDQSMPKPRELSNEEQLDLTKQLSAHFQQEPGQEAQFLAAGAYRFINTPRFSYIDRTDTGGSVAFENPNYGATLKPLEAATVTKKVLLPRLEASLKKAALDTSGMRFVRFQDEFAAAGQPGSLPRNFDPRKAGIHVARTALYERDIQGVPIFGSELVVGLMPEGEIGRLRMHWPKIDAKSIATAQALQRKVRSGAWKPPKSLRSKDTTILDVSAGVGHSGFADPGLKVEAVVRVLYRTRSRDRKYPLQTTGYKYFDQAGQEISFHAFPRLPDTPQESKPEIAKVK
jgi:hypothetical protein